VVYHGFRGFNTPDSGLVPRSNQSFYFPIHYQEPVAGNEAAIDLDYYSSESRIRAVDAMFETKGPSLTDRLSLVSAGAGQSRCGVDNVASYGVVVMHPGIALTNQPDVWPRDFSSIVVCIPDLITRSISTEGKDSKIFIHDISDPTSGGEPVFLGAASVVRETNGAVNIEFIEEEPFNSLSDGKLFHHQNIKAADRVWTITVVGVEGRWDSSMVFVIVGGVIILFASITLAFWVRTDERRTKKFNEIRQEAEHEKAALILKNARQATKTERELNDFIAHEVRNPVAAAMAACNFLQAEINKREPLVDEESRELAREDMNIIDNALKFVNDLLRNMLDMHRAASKQLQVKMVPTDLLHDILEPVGGMLHRRGSKVKVIVDCPDNFWIMADPLRLKQVILNLGRNSSKFIDEGFIRLKAEETDGNVILYVDDSGSGIPADKRDRIFAKFQESLDMLSQGTVSTVDFTVAVEKKERLCLIILSDPLL
jgi:signal transduction histidine kinase